MHKRSSFIVLYAMRIGHKSRTADNERIISVQMIKQDKFSISKN